MVAIEEKAAVRVAFPPPMEMRVLTEGFLDWTIVSLHHRRSLIAGVRAPQHPLLDQSPWVGSPSPGRALLHTVGVGTRQAGGGRARALREAARGCGGGGRQRECGGGLFCA
ncbi:hypothetical protein C2S52_015826 [Perilla frutescens var. hirtella]|nr:hypothetical protein C2S52_015826 [Perilla frutescens var. hirtella]KAH6815380.1 hypothetical protein C2S51_020200 [Perilla frutescens var. frutescens]